MRILLTGASSFSGLWFARALAASGHEVVAALRGTRGSYGQGVRAERVAELGRVAVLEEECVFGSERFLALAASGPWDLLCHHAAEVGNYRSPDFDVPGAVAANIRALPTVLRTMAGQGLRGMVLTGSVFEQDEGSGNAPLQAFSPYGLSKGLTAQVVRYWCGVLGIPLGKFVIPNPFGPFEEPRFCTYLIRTWKSGQAAEVRTPAYVRDNIHVDLLAASYARFAATVAGGPAFSRCNPSGYVESQGAFAQRFAAEIARRSGLDCQVILRRQTEFEEPATRINTEPAASGLDWNEDAAWDAIAEYYAIAGAIVGA
jgi:UDP-glucose 4-epimerase